MVDIRALAESQFNLVKKQKRQRAPAKAKLTPAEKLIENIALQEKMLTGETVQNAKGKEPQSWFVEKNDQILFKPKYGIRQIIELTGDDDIGFALTEGMTKQDALAWLKGLAESGDLTQRLDELDALNKADGEKRKAAKKN